MSFPELTAFARHLERTSPDDQDEHALNCDRAQELFAFVKKSGAPELGICLEAASKLLEVLKDSSSRVSQAEILAIACQAIRAVERGVDALEPVQPKAEGEAAPELDPNLAQINTMVLGKMLLELKHATRKQVNAALKMQREKGLPIGECLLVHGVSADHLLDTLNLQRELRASPSDNEIRPPSGIKFKPREDPPAPMPDFDALPASEEAAAEPKKRATDSMFIGEVLIGAGIIDSEQLAAAMMVHHVEGISVGQSLMRTGAITEIELQQGLKLQRKLRNVIGLSA